MKPGADKRKTKIFFFDAGPIISLVVSRLSWILPELKKKSNSTFYITPAVQRELIERPLTVRRFEFEALQVMKLIREGILEVYSAVPMDRVKQLQQLANSSFSIQNKTLDIIQSGEIESVASALQLKDATVVMDERTLRLFIENRQEMKKLLEHRFQNEVSVNLQTMKKFSDQLHNITIIRSVELVGVAYKLGLLNSYVPLRKDGREILLDSVLWATKYNGCAVTEHEIEELKDFLLKK